MATRVAPRCLVCDRPVVVARNTMCQPCEEAFDRLVRRDGTTLGLVRWAALRARKFQKIKDLHDSRLSRKIVT